MFTVDTFLDRNINTLIFWNFNLKIESVIIELL